MSTQIFVDLHVSDLENSQKFCEALGFSLNYQSTDDHADWLVNGGHNYAMLLTPQFN